MSRKLTLTFFLQATLRQKLCPETNDGSPVPEKKAKEIQEQLAGAYENCTSEVCDAIKQGKSLIPMRKPAFLRAFHEDEEYDDDSIEEYDEYDEEDFDEDDEDDEEKEEESDDSDRPRVERV